MPVRQTIGCIFAEWARSWRTDAKNAGAIICFGQRMGIEKTGSRIGFVEKSCDEMDRYNVCLRALRPLIPDDEFMTVMTQDMCELEPDFLGFVDIYKPLSELIPKGKTVIDFGCYLAAQSYFFAEHKCYIGVDVVDMKRFTPPNAVHYISSIQNFIANEVPKLFQEHGEGHYCAICSYVPDFKATELVRKTFLNVFCYYPSLDGADVTIKL